MAPSAFTLPVIAGLALAGRPDVAETVAARYVARERTSRFEPATDRLFGDLTALSEAQVDALLDVMAGLDARRGTSPVARALAAADDTALLDRFLAAVEAHGGLDPLEEQVPRDLARRIRKWRRSRGH